MTSFRFTDLAENLSGRILSEIKIDPLELRRYPVTTDRSSPFFSDSVLLAAFKSEQSLDNIYAANTLHLEEDEVTATILLHPKLVGENPEILESVVRHQIAEVVLGLWTSERRVQPLGINSIADVAHSTRRFWLSDTTRAAAAKSSTSFTNRFVKFLAENPTAIYHLSPREFEELVAELFKREGYEVELTKQSRDGGKDIIAQRRTIAGFELLTIECKRYAKGNKVGIDVIQRSNGVRDEMQATKGVIATTSFFTQPAQDSAAAKPNQIGLLDYYAICEFLTKHKDVDDI